MRKFIGLALIMLMFWQCRTERSQQAKITGLKADSAMVVSARREASRIGLDVLRKGGNAFDAMIATDLALAVAYPVAGNIGGGGFMVYRSHDGEIGTLDYREKAPLGATKDMYLDEKGEVIKGKSRLGAMAVGVPGTIAGLFEIHDKFGKLPMEELIQPAIDLARRGVEVTEKQASSLNGQRENFFTANGREIWLDREWKKGDSIRYMELASTLERIRDHGEEEFYKGITAERLVAGVRQLGGIITMEDMERYEPIWRAPIVDTYRGYKVISMPPPSSGGICLVQLLKSVEPYDLGKLGHNSEEYIQLLTEAERRVYADRAHFLGDPDFVSIPVDTLMSATYNKGRMQTFDWDRATASEEVSHGEISVLESAQTTHYSIVDAQGNAVAVTTTLNGAYGSKVNLEGLGFFLNNQMDDFSAKPGTPNMFGLIGAEANAIAPEKRMLSSMTPTIVEKDGALFMVVGTPGGSTIITSVFQTILNVLDFDMGMQESVAQKRFHHQWLPDMILFERDFDTIDFAELRKKGYKLQRKDSRIIGKVDAILVMPDGSLEGGADPRGDDAAAGY